MGGWGAQHLGMWAAAAALALATQRASLQAAVVGGFSYPNFFHASLLAPSGGHILSSPAKKEYGKKDAAQGGGDPALRTHPLGWVSVEQVAWYGLPD